MLYTFNLSCSNHDPSAPYVTGWSYGNSAVTDPVGLVARTGPAPPYRPTLTLSNVVIGNTSIALRIGDVQSSRPAPNAYGNPIEQYELQLEDLDAPSGGNGGTHGEHTHLPLSRIHWFPVLFQSVQ